MAVSTDQLIMLLNNLGFYQFVLPWLFVFAVVFGLLKASKLFGDANPKISAVLALVIAFFATAYTGPAMATFFISIFSGATLIIAGILVVLLFIFMFGFNTDIFTSDKNKNRPALIMIVMIIIGVILFIVATGTASGIGVSAFLSGDLVAMILVLIVLIAAVWLIVKENGKETVAPAGGGAAAGK
ncbi:MAG: hypothetical protein ABIA21_03980 [Candidatus Aenigmatarchaeota archaeon]